MALDGAKRPCRIKSSNAGHCLIKSSNAGHCLFAGIAGADRAARVADGPLPP